MIKSLLRFMPVAVILLLVTVCGAAEVSEEFTWNKVTYLKMDDGWYAKDTNQLFKVAEYSISARLIDSDNRSDVVTLLNNRGYTLVRENRLNIMDIHIPTDQDIMNTVKELYATGLFRYVEPNTIGKWAATPNDPGYGSCWGLNNTGQSGGTADADVDAPEAWDIHTGDSDIVVAVLDSGTEFTHEDLQDNIWANPGETPDNGIDDDNNGYVDDVVGWDFENDDSDPTGTYFHGTHVAGCIAAVNDNGIGISSIAGGWTGNHGVSMMICLVGSDAPLGEIIDDAILYAADNGARIVTLSLTVTETTAINDAVEDAYNNSNVFLDCASGNNYGSVGYPARLDNMVAIGATDHNDVKADFSNYGPELELTAPGVDIYSTQLSNSYDYSSGTSFAAPYAAGVAALILSAAPSLTNAELRQLMWDTADDLGPAGFDNNYGYGRVNAFNALQQTSGLYIDKTAYPCQDTLNITVRDSDSSGTVQVTVMSSTETTPETVTLTEGSPAEFTGSIDLDSTAPQTGDGVLSVNHGDTVTIEYAPLSESIDVPVDCSAPAISAVTVDSFSESTAVITFTTDEPAFPAVVYGEGTPSMTQSSSTSGVEHSVTISGLDDCTTYAFYVTAEDLAGNSAMDNNGGANYGFTTLALVVMLEANMDSDPGWSYEGQWAYGDPQGNDGDPDAGYTGTNVVGYNLAGDYTNNMSETYCTTSSFDCIGAANVYFSFYKWLGVESASYDHASIEVSNNGGSSWTQIWDHTGSSVSGGSWEYVEFDISAIASGNSDVQIRWVMGDTDSSVTYCGWNIDDVMVSYTEPCTSPTATPNPCNNDGDVTLDGAITAGDAQLAFQIALGSYSPSFEEECAADCNGDSSITAGDAQLIFTTALGMDSCTDPV